MIIMSDPFNNMNTTQTFQGVQTTQQKPQLEWKNGEGLVTEVAQIKSGTNKKGEPWVLYSLKIQDSTGIKKYSSFKQVNINDYITFNFTEEPAEYNGRSFMRRSLKSFEHAQRPVPGMENKESTLQSQQIPPLSNVTANKTQTTHTDVSVFLGQYLGASQNPSVYEFIGVYMVKKMAETELVKNLINAFNQR